MVSDSSQGQDDVEANVTVQVKSLQPSEITHTTPLTLAADSDTVVRPDIKVHTFAELCHCFMSCVMESLFYISHEIRTLPCADNLSKAVLVL